MLAPAPVSRSRAVAVPALPALLAAAAAAAAGSLLVARPLGYDAWAWMVWARELAHGRLATGDGPAFKALPVLAAAPLARFGDLAPLSWLVAMRACALLCLPAAFVAGSRLGGVAAGAAAAVLVALEPDLFRTAVYGASEPLLVLLVLLAAARLLAGGPRSALVLLAAAGLIRPELWPLVLAAGGVLLARERRADPLLLAAMLAPPAIWLGLAWAGAGTSPAQLVHAARPGAGCPGCAVAVPAVRALADLNHPTDAVGVLGRLAEAFVLPALVLALVGTVAAARRRLAGPLVLAAFAAAWILVVALMAQAGYPGSRRYLVGPAALLALLAGLGLATTLASVRGRRARAATAAVVAACVLAAAAPAVRGDLALVSTARGEQRTQAALRDAVRAAGGRERVLRAGRPAVNPVMQTALAWDLRTSLATVQAAWGSTARRPHWRAPAYVFRGPAHDAGPPPAFPPGRSAQVAARAGAWTVLRSPAPVHAAPARRTVVG